MMFRQLRGTVLFEALRFALYDDSNNTTNVYLSPFFNRWINSFKDATVL